MSRPAFISVGEFGRKSSAHHQFEEAGLPDLVLSWHRFGCVDELGLRDVVRDALKELLRRLEGTSDVVLGQIAALEHQAGVVGERNVCGGASFTCGHGYTSIPAGLHAASSK